MNLSDFFFGPNMQIINEYERGLLIKNGIFKSVLKPGRHNLFLKKTDKIIVCNVNDEFLPDNLNINIFLKNEELVKELDITEIPYDRIVLRYEDDNFAGLLKSGKHAFWNIFKKHRFDFYDIKDPVISDKIDKNIFLDIPDEHFEQFEILSYETGLLFYNGVFRENLKSGSYYYWKTATNVSVLKVDMRQQQIDINGQEIMSEDKVTLRLNFVCQYRIVDPYKCLIEINDYQTQLYNVLQLILREYVGSQKLDDLLLKKSEIENFVLDKLKQKREVFGVEFISAGLKDVILPGEIKDILNKVLIAQKEAQANVITRREETASTRSLLNTAKLMDENATLYRLKELEYIEKIFNKIGSISLSSGSNILEQLNSLLGTNKK